MPVKGKNPKSKGLLCGAKRTHRAGTCTLAAGFGTDHVGHGRCKFHGGCSPAQRLAASRADYAAKMEMYGVSVPVEITPTKALIEEVYRTAGHVQWLANKVGELPTVIEISPRGDTVPSVWIRMYQGERDHLVKTCKVAIECGVAEKMVNLAMQQGRLIADGLQEILQNLNLSEEQQQKAPAVVRAALMRIASFDRPLELDAVSV